LECSEVSVDEKVLEKVMEGLTIPNARGIHDDSQKPTKNGLKYWFMFRYSATCTLATVVETCWC